MNIWVGYNTGQPISSGLHHDFHDNLYLLIAGQKRFKLYAPKDAKYMYTFGQIKKIFHNGLISYVDNIRADGALLEDVAKWNLRQAEIALENAENGEGDLEEAEKKVDDAMDQLLQFGDYDDLPETKKVRIDQDEYPDSFSRIKNMSELHAFPKVKRSTCYDITLNAGEALFLPAGWFHEVRSCGSDASNGLHMAFNYLMVPPTESDFDRPYCDGFWEAQWEDFLEQLKDFKNIRA
jgi:hypothetical protein